MKGKNLMIGSTKGGETRKITDLGKSPKFTKI
jgi:hypothetical protein